MSHWTDLAVCVIGIYVSFLTWAVLQERITTTPYGDDNRIFSASNAITGIQSTFACLTGYAFLRLRRGSRMPLVPRDYSLIRNYLLVAGFQALSVPFQYASLRYVDYVTMLLAKSCKLVPVMAVHLLLHRTRFPAYKFAVVGLVTIGVSIFSLYHPTSKSGPTSDSQAWGFLLLSINLLLDGLYNTTQDQMFKHHRGLTGPHMMTVLNFLTAVLGFGAVAISNQLHEVMWFAQHHPQVYRDIALFGICGAIGQVFVFLTLEKFGSLALVTTTVTRKMFSMVLSVVLFGHRLAPMQWVGVVVVFSGIIAEALAKRLK